MLKRRRETTFVNSAGALGDKDDRERKQSLERSSRKNGLTRLEFGVAVITFVVVMLSTTAVVRITRGKRSDVKSTDSKQIRGSMASISIEHNGISISGVPLPPPPSPLPLPQQLLSRDADFAIVTTDVRGNLGPASVLQQTVPGEDWLKDRWQAASDMHGTAIHGAHWVQYVFGNFRNPTISHNDIAKEPFVRVASLVLDWETAVSNDYTIQCGNHSLSSFSREYEKNNSASFVEWETVFDSTKDSYTIDKWGQSPGVKQAMPLHILHNVTLATMVSSAPTCRVVRLWIRSSDHGWGVSLWQVDVYGWKDQKSMNDTRFKSR
jgi:hypothetical protein